MEPSRPPAPGWIEFATSPNRAFAQLFASTPSPNWKDAVVPLWKLEGMLIGSLWLFGFISDKITGTVTPFDPASAVLVLIMVAISAPIQLAITSGFQHILCYLLGGKGTWLQTAMVTAYAFITGGILYLALLALSLIALAINNGALTLVLLGLPGLIFLYAIHVTARGYQHAHDFTYPRALAATLVPYLIAALLLALVFGALFVSILGIFAGQPGHLANQTRAGVNTSIGTPTTAHVWPEGATSVDALSALNTPIACVQAPIGVNLSPTSEVQRYWILGTRAKSFITIKGDTRIKPLTPQAFFDGLDTYFSTFYSESDCRWNKAPPKNPPATTFASQASQLSNPFRLTPENFDCQPGTFAPEDVAPPNDGDTCST